MFVVTLTRFKSKQLEQIICWVIFITQSFQYLYASLQSLYLFFPQQLVQHPSSHSSCISDCLLSWVPFVNSLYSNRALLKCAVQSGIKYFQGEMHSALSSEWASTALVFQILLLKEAYDCNNILIARSYSWLTWSCSPHRFRSLEQVN